MLQAHTMRVHILNTSESKSVDSLFTLCQTVLYISGLSILF